MNPAERLQRAEEFVFAGRLEESRALLREGEFNEPALIRKKFHIEGKIAFSKCDYVSAVEIFEDCLQRFGSHILLKADLLLGYYMQEKHLAWEDNLDSLLSTLRNLKFDVIGENWVRAAISCGKLLEESGRVSEALALYKECFRHSEIAPVWQRRALIQILLCHSLFFEADEILPYYRKLTMLAAKGDEIFHVHETRHAILMAEMTLLSTTELNQVVGLMCSTYAEKNRDVLQWFLYDLLELHLLRKRNLPIEILKIITDFEPHHDYERALLQIHLRPGSLVLEDVQNLNVSPFSRVKLWYMIQGYDGEAARRLQLWIKASSITDQKIYLDLLARCRSVQGRLEIILQSDGQLCLANETLDLAKKKNLLLLISAFSGSRERSEKDLIQILWQEDVNIYSQDRLRVSINRLNSELRRFTTGQKLLRYQEGSVQLNELAQIKVVRAGSQDV